MASAPERPNQALRATGAGCLFVLDDEGVFFSVARQELYVFNTSATLIWCCIEDGLSADAIVRHYRDAFGVSDEDARAHVAMAVAQWSSLGYIEAPELPATLAIPFTTALARLLSNDALRSAFASVPAATATTLQIDAADLDAVLALDSPGLDEQASWLRDLAKRRDLPLPGGDTLFAWMANRERSVLEVAVDGRVRSTSATALERHYRMLTTTICVRFASAAQESCVHAALAHLAITPRPPANDVLLDIVESDCGLVILEDVVPVGYCRTLAELTPLVKSLIAQAAINRHRFFLQFHAGVISNGERCVLLPGPPGSGKTTLTIGLTLAGFAYFSDEVALLEEETLHLRPFPLALGIKPGAVATVAELWPAVSQLQAHAREDGERVRYLSLPHERCAPIDTLSPAGWLIFPRYGPELDTELRPISRPEALRRLMQECMVLPQLLDEARVEQLVRWMRGLECFELPMSSLAKAVELVQERCRR